MKIVVFGAAGKAGRLIAAEAARRGHQVTAIARNPAQLTNLPAGVVAVAGDATSAASVRKIAPGADALVVAIGGTDNTVWSRAATMLVETLRGLGGPAPRIIHMGGGASLLTPEGTRFLDAPGFPKAFRGPAAGQSEALEVGY